MFWLSNLFAEYSRLREARRLKPRVVHEAPEEVVEAEVESSPQEDGLTGTPLDAYEDSLQQPEAESNQSQFATPSNEFEFDTAAGSAPISSEAGNDFFAMDPVIMF